MAKYIDADKLTTIIEERKAQQDQWANRYHDPINQGISQELTEILSIIDSLQHEQPEVDLEKEIDKEWKNCCPIDEGMGDESALLVIEQFHYIAHHFYELGFNARKEESK